MRVALVQETLDARRGGAETSVLQMAGQLARLGADVTILHSGRDRPAAPAGVQLLALHAGGPSRAWRTYRFVQAAQRVCRIQRFPIVHAITPCLCANVYQPRSGTYPQTIRRNLALTARAWWPLARLARAFNVRQTFLAQLERGLLCRRAARVWVAAVSEYVAQQVQTDYGFPAARIRVVFNGVDVVPPAPQDVPRLREARRRELGLSSNTPLVLLVAHNFKLKGLRELLLATARGGDWHLAVVGKGAARPYQQMATRLDVARRVHFVGPRADVRDWYAAADVLAHPTWHDPCSRVVLEALMLGLPVVTTRSNGAAELLAPQQSEFVVDSPADTTGLAQAIRAALTPAVRAAFTARAPAWREQLSMARHARELLSLYREVLAEPGCAGGLY